MRWKDLPAEDGPADRGDSPVLRRGDWEDLKQRLESLPPGHPSAPDDDAAETDDDENQEPDRPGNGEAGERRDHEPDPGRGGAGRRDGRGGSDAPSGAEAGAGSRPEPYRPWFASSDSSEPWFYADPGADAVPP
jgi:hypothetical protein